jgi:exopolysaccharide biosynthesis protein
MTKKGKKKRYILNKIIASFSILLIPFFVGIKIVEENHNDIFSSNFLIAKELILYFLIFLFIINMIVLFKNKCLKGDRKTIAIISSFLLFIVLELSASLSLLYYNNEFKDWIITTSIGSINYRYVATNIYNEKTIDKVIDKEIKKVDVNYEKDIVSYDDLTYDRVHYKNEEEEALLKHEEDEYYKIIKVEGTTIGADYHYEGYMAIIYDPSRVTIAKSSGAGTFEGSYGETLATISRKNNAKIAMNAGGFYDPFWNSNGGIPHGAVIINGKLDSDYERGVDSGGIVGFNKDNKMVLKRMTAEQALAEGIRDAVDWGPYLIVDGVNQFKDITWYTWTCGRTAIGQRADGVVLMLVIDGLQEHSKGASYADMAAIMEKYGAVQAANMDGGTSTSMTLDHNYINSPWNGYRPTWRWFPNAWIVK